MPLPTLFFSNRVECLFAAVAPSLYASPFGKKMVIVPSIAMKQWLCEALVRDPEYRLAFGFYPLLLHQAVQVINESLGDPINLPPSQVVLGWKLQAEIDRILNEEAEDPRFSPIVEYCSKNREEQSAGLALKLAKLFHDYRENAPAEMAQLAEVPGNEFQHLLWNRVCPKPVYGESASREKEAMEIHLFGISYLSPAIQNFFNELHDSLSVHYWILSPSRLFWEDQLTNRERISWMKKWKGKEGDLEAFEEFLASGNPLLSQNGKLGRHWLKRLESFPSDSAECYLIADKALAYPSFEEHMIDGIQPVDEPWTLLSSVQADLALLRNPTEEIIDFVEDDSIQVHSAPSPLREVEALYHTLNHLMEADDNLMPQEVVILAADFDRYEPLIRTVFGREKSRLKVEILESSLVNSPMVCQFRRLVELTQGRIESAALLNFAGEPIFWKKQEFSADEWAEFKGWFEEANPSALFDEKMWKRLAHQFAFEGNQGFSVAETLGKWQELFQKLLNDLSVFRDGRKDTLQGWSEQLKMLFEAYVFVEDNEEESRYLFTYLRSLGQQLPDVLFSFETVYAHVAAELSRSRGVYQEQKLQAVRVSSLLPMRAIPAKVVALVGMSQGVVPKGADISSLDRFIHYAPGVKRSQPGDFDRYLFMESLLSAREKLLIFYTRPEGATAPSIVVEELLQTIDSGYTIRSAIPSSQIIRVHPDHAFDRVYFSKGALQINHSAEDFEAAQAYYRLTKEKEAPFAFEKPIEHTDLDISLLPLEIHLEELEALMRHPLKLFHKEALGVFPKQHKKESHALEEFEGEDFLLHELKQASLFAPIEEVLHEALRENKLPAEPFREAALARYRKQLSEQKQQVANAGLSEEIFQVEFTHGIDQMVKISSQHIQLPPVWISYEGKQVAIVGKLPFCCRQGLISLRSTDPEDRYKELPREWILNHIPETVVAQKIFYPLEQVSKMPSKPEWELLLAHHLRAKMQPVPLLPKLISSLSQGNEDRLERAIETASKPSAFGDKDHHLLWLLRNHKLPEAHTLIKDWKTYASTLHQEES